MWKALPLLALLLLASNGGPRPDYVPDTGWSDEAWARRFYERWIGDQLAAMDEPPLARPSDLGPLKSRFRVTVLPSFHPAYAYRVDRYRDGSATFHWALLSGKGGYAPGHLVESTTRRLTPAELRELQSAISGAALGSLERDIPIPGPVRTADGSLVVTVCADGTLVVFERLDRTGRRFVIRHCGIPEKRLRRLLRRVLRLHPHGDDV